MRTSFLRKKTTIINNIKRFLYDNRFFFIFLLGLFLLGFVTGVFVTIKKCDYLTVEILNKFLIYRLLSNKITVFSYVLRKLLFWGLIFIFAFFMAKLKPSIMLFMATIFIMCYYLGLLITTIICLFGFLGVLNCLLIILPFEILLYTAFIFYMVYCLQLRTSFYRCCYDKNRVIKENMFFFFLLLFLIIIEGICINLVSSTIIFVI